MLAVTRTVLALGAVVLAAAPLRAQRRSNVITAEEVERAQPNVGTAYDAGPGQVHDLQLAQLHVYLDDVDVGGVDYLKTIPAERVFELRWLSANQAASRYGPTDGPAIVVTLKR